MNARHIRSAGPLSAVLLVGILLRLSLAWMPGHGGDSVTMRRWMESAARLGMLQSYEKQIDPTATLPVYGPVAMTVLTLDAKFAMATMGDAAFTQPFENLFIKLPGILADAGILLLLWRMLRKRGERIALVGASIYAVHPAAIHLNGFWGQIDSVALLFTLGALTALRDKRWALTGCCLVLGIFTKPQIVLLTPLFAAALWAAGMPVIQRAALGTGLTLLGVLTPFYLDARLPAVTRAFDLSYVLHESRLSWNAFNVWWMLHGPGAWNMPASTSLGSSPVTLGTVGWLAFGTGLLLLAIAVFRRKNDAAFLWDACALCVLLAFAVLPEMHERYVFPFIALGIPSVFRTQRWAFGYSVVSAVIFLNLLAVLPFYGSGAYLDYAMPLTRVLAAALVAATVLLGRETLQLHQKRVARSFS